MQWRTTYGFSLRISIDDPELIACGDTVTVCPIVVGVFGFGAGATQFTLVATVGSQPIVHVSDGVTQAHALVPGQLRLLQFDDAVTCQPPDCDVEVSVTPLQLANDFFIYTLQQQADGAATGVPAVPVNHNVSASGGPSCAQWGCWAVWPFQLAFAGVAVGTSVRVQSVNDTLPLIVALSVGNSSAGANVLVTVTCIRLSRSGML